MSIIFNLFNNLLVKIVNCVLVYLDNFDDDPFSTYCMIYNVYKILITERDYFNIKYLNLLNNNNEIKVITNFLSLSFSL